jgi:drug/metabolite transporter (DMT)-like permease
MITILVRILLLPSINVFQKKLTQNGFNSLFIMSFMYLLLSILSCVLFLINRTATIQPQFWPAIAVAGMLDALGNIFLVQSLKYTDLSVFGPLNAFKPVISLVIGIFILQEIPNGKGIIGILIILMGSIFLTYDGTGKKSQLLSRGVLYRFLCIACSATAAIYSKKAIQCSNAEITLFYWSLAGLPVLLIPLYTRYKDTLREDIGKLKKQLVLGIPLVICFFLMQYLTLLTFKNYFVGYTLAAFQLSSILSVLYGYGFFKEKNIRRKIISSGIMIIGTTILLYH